MPPHPLTNFEIQKYFQNNAQRSSKNEPRFNGVYSRYNLPKTKDGTYVINLDEYSNIGTHWIAFYASNISVAYFDSFGIEHIPKEIKTFINKSTIVTNIFEYKHMIRHCADIFVLDLLILCFQERL